MAAERVRIGRARAKGEGKTLRVALVASAWENESVRPWRLLAGLVCAGSPARFGVNPGTVQRISRPFVAPSVVALIP
jgi:hypothetical protein